MKFFSGVLCSLIFFAVSVEAQRNASALEAKRAKRVSSKPADDSATNDKSTPNEPEHSPGSDFRIYVGPDAPIKILSKPRATFPQDGNRCLQGSVLLKAYFLADGTIGKVVVVRGLPHGLSEQAIEAAGKIKFVPKIENGVYVASVMTVEYPFSY